MKNNYVKSHHSYRRRYEFAINYNYKNLDSISTKIHRNIYIVSSAALIYVDELISKQYYKFESPPTPASHIFRSMLLSIISGFTSITRWTNELKIQLLYAISSAFTPDKTPGISIYYDFIKRMWSANTKHFSANIRLPNEK